MHFSIFVLYLILYHGWMCGNVVESVINTIKSSPLWTFYPYLFWNFEGHIFLNLAVNDVESMLIVHVPSSIKLKYWVCWMWLYLSNVGSTNWFFSVINRTCTNSSIPLKLYKNKIFSMTNYASLFIF